MKGKERPPILYLGGMSYNNNNREGKGEEGKENQREKEKEGKGRGGRGRRGEGRRRGKMKGEKEEEREEKKERRDLIGLRMWLRWYRGLPSTHKAPGSIPSPASMGQSSTCLSSQHSETEAGRSQVGGQPELRARSYLEKNNNNKVGWGLNI